MSTEAESQSKCFLIFSKSSFSLSISLDFCQNLILVKILTVFFANFCWLAIPLWFAEWSIVMPTDGIVLYKTQADEQVDYITWQQVACKGG